MKNRLWVAAWALFFAAQLTWLLFPVARVPGYELATGLSLLTALFGGAFGIACGRHEAMRAVSAPAAQVWWATASAMFVLGVPALTTVVLAGVVTSAFTPCSPFDTLAFVPVLVGPSVFLASAIGVAVGLRFRRWWAFTLSWLAVVLLSAAHTVWPIVFGPQVSAWNHLAGFLPGPLYDEELQLPAALLWFRLGSVLLGVLVMALAARHLGARSRKVTRVAWSTLAALMVLEAMGPTLGFRMSDAALEERLGGRTETAHLTLIHPRGLSPAELDRIVGDLEFRFAQISTFLGGPPPDKVRVWWYRSAAQKQQLVGAANTQFAKPWRHEIHVNESGFPHPVVKHELVHAMAASFGARPFGVTATWFGLNPHVGIVEGLAVAADNPIDELSLSEWSAAMKQQSMLPDVRALLEPQGFYGAPASRAYTTAGAFLRWLQDTRGPEKLRDLYRDGDFQRVYGTDAGALATGWEAFLDTVPLDPLAVNQAFARFRRGSLFDRPCAREVARLSARIAERSADDGPLALELISRCQALQPDEPAHVLARVATLRRLGRTEEVGTLLEALAARVKDQPSSWAEVAMVQVDLALARNDDSLARALLEQVLALKVSPSMDRTVHVRLHSLETSGAVREALGRYFTGTPEPVVIFLLREALASSPQEPFVAYLLGRKLSLGGGPSEALPLLELARRGAVPASLQREALRLSIEAAFSAGRCEQVKALADEARGVSGPFGARAHDWVERCEALQSLPTAPPTKTP